MTRSDFFFWVLAGVVAGVFAVSFVSFSVVLQVIFFAAAAVAAIIAIKRKSAAAAMAAALVFGFSLGVVRSEHFWVNAGDGGRGIFETPHILRRIKGEFEGSLMRIFPEPEASLAAGILLGRSAEFAPGFEDALRRTSTMHIVSVSGYNITVVASNVLRFFEIFRAPLLISWWGAVASVVLFTLLVGAPASAVRAAIMGIVVLVGKRIGRASPQRIVLLFAAVAMLMYRPDLLRFDVGFQLSFLATIGIFWMAPIIEEKLFRGKRLGGFSRICSETLGAQLLVAPWIIYEFGNLSVFGAIANVIVLPTVPLAMLLGLVSGAAGMVLGAAASLVAPVAYLPLTFATRTITFASDLPFAAFHIENAPLWFVTAAYALIFAFLFRWWRTRHDHE